jgi:folate-binding Fe-S cluster repair protein YgfZ
MKAALLPDRGVVKVDGDDARKFLNGLVTSDIATGAREAATFSSLRTPQATINVDVSLGELPAGRRRRLLFSTSRARAPVRCSGSFLQAARQSHHRGFVGDAGVLAVFDAAP